ncbi:hypothetical protein ILT44_13650 [Microvirga sp. BT689]|uniref:hypothetical protein n=1 Tax=Microvirga arvi TaxID=2778731 RepID=UPI0019507A6C|nr:hypothetical protein [Microvirga arvi]MBM6581235.1 hypothetical protein [Microvirga arvi]
MSETSPMKIAVGDEVRVHFHPPGSWKSFFEGLVRRVDVPSAEGRFFVVEVTHEVILDREHRIRPGFQDYVRYECRNDFPGRIEVLSATKLDVEREGTPRSTTAETPEAEAQDAHEQQAPQADLCRESEVELPVEVKADDEQFHVHLEHEPVRKQTGLITALFGRKK